MENKWTMFEAYMSFNNECSSYYVTMKVKCSSYYVTMNVKGSSYYVNKLEFGTCHLLGEQLVKGFIFCHGKMVFPIANDT